MKRTFIAIDIPENIKKEIVKIQKQIPSFNGKLTEYENLHLTLKFLGEIDEKVIEEIRKKLRELKFTKFNVQIDKLGFFRKEHGAIVWLHLANCDELQKEIDKKLEGLFESEKRFMSHLTIARVKSVNVKNNFFSEIEKIKFIPLNFEVNEFVLKESILDRKGPSYKDIERYKLE